MTAPTTEAQKTHPGSSQAETTQEILARSREVILKQFSAKFAQAIKDKDFYSFTRLVDGLIKEIDAKNVDVGAKKLHELIETIMGKSMGMMIRKTFSPRIPGSENSADQIKYLKQIATLRKILADFATKDTLSKRTTPPSSPIGKWLHNQT